VSPFAGWCAGSVLDRSARRERISSLSPNVGKPVTRGVPEQDREEGSPQPLHGAASHRGAMGGSFAPVCSTQAMLCRRFSSLSAQPAECVVALPASSSAKSGGLGVSARSACLQRRRALASWHLLGSLPAHPPRDGLACRTFESWCGKRGRREGRHGFKRAVRSRRGEVWSLEGVPVRR
jgi:hypothetical protein